MITPKRAHAVPAIYFISKDSWGTPRRPESFVETTGGQRRHGSGDNGLRGAQGWAQRWPLSLRRSTG